MVIFLIQSGSKAEKSIFHNCIDRHLELHANKTALIWEGDDPDDSSGN